MKKRFLALLLALALVFPSGLSMFNIDKTKTTVTAAGGDMGDFITDKEIIDSKMKFDNNWFVCWGIERTAGGRLFISYVTGLDSEMTTIGQWDPIMMSDDDGNTWEAIAAVTNPSKNFQSTVLWIDPIGRLWVIYSDTIDSSVRAVICEDPDAETLVFLPPRFIGWGIQCNKPIVTSGGSYLFPISIQSWLLPAVNVIGPGQKQDYLYAIESKDEGESFQITGHAEVPVWPVRDWDEPVILEKNNGSLEYYVRTGRSGGFNGIGKSVSTDGGKTWTVAVDSGIPGPTSRFHISRLKSGRVLMVNHHNFSGANRNNMTALLSDDDGATWPHKLLLDARYVSYPDAAEGADGNIYVVYDYARYGSGRQMLTARITEADIIAGSLVTPGSYLQKVVITATGGSRDLSKYPSPDKQDMGYFMLDDFDGYADYTALKAKWTAGSVNPGTTAELITGTDAKSGKSLKLSNGAGTNRYIDIRADALQQSNDLPQGISVWVKNLSTQIIKFSVIFPNGNRKPQADGIYYTKKNGNTVFSPAECDGSDYPILIPAGYSGEIAIPFFSYGAGEIDTTSVALMFNGEASSQYYAVADEVKLYVIDIYSKYPPPADDYTMLDNFDAYADSAASKIKWLNYEYGNPDTEIELISGGQAKAGNALKLSNSDVTLNRADVTNTSLSWVPGSKGISVWVNNTSGVLLGFGPAIAWSYYPVMKQRYYTKADGDEEYTMTSCSGSTKWVPIEIPAGFKGEIAIPFASFGYVEDAAPVATGIAAIQPLTLQFFAPSASVFSVAVDDVQLYGKSDGLPDESEPQPLGDTYITLDDFDGYADMAAMWQKWYSRPTYGANTTAGLITGSDAKSGKALKLSNGAGADVEISTNSFVNMKGATGISVWINNPGMTTLFFSVYLMNGWCNPLLGESYWAKADGTDEYVLMTCNGTNEYFPITIPAGFKGEIAIPFASYGDVEIDISSVLIWFWGTTEPYYAVIDDIRLYLPPADTIAVVDLISKPYAAVPRAQGETYKMQLAVDLLNVYGDKITQGYSVSWALAREKTGVTITADGRLIVTGAAEWGTGFDVVCTVTDLSNGAAAATETFNIALIAGDLDLESTGAAKSPPKASKKNYFAAFSAGLAILGRRCLLRKEYD